MTWTKYDADLWSEDDRFAIFPCQNGWFCRDQHNNQSSDPYRTPEEAMAWAERRLLDPPFDGNTPPTRTIAGYIAPPPPGQQGDAP